MNSLYLPGIIGTIIGIVVLSVGTMYLPQQGGQVPPDMTPEAFSQQQYEMMLNSLGFKMIVGGLVTGAIGCLSIGIVSHCGFTDRSVAPTDTSAEEENDPPPDIIIHELLPQP
jgi:uncharacterized protein (DUF2062 family)